jgi:BRCA1 C Terminus (BRCT) domain
MSLLPLKLLLLLPLQGAPPTPLPPPTSFLKAIVRRADKLGVVCVTTDWAVQCLLCSRRIAFKAADSFTQPFAHLRKGYTNDTSTTSTASTSGSSSVWAAKSDAERYEIGDCVYILREGSGAKLKGVVQGFSCTATASTAVTTTPNSAAHYGAAVTTATAAVADSVLVSLLVESEHEHKVLRGGSATVQPQQLALKRLCGRFVMLHKADYESRAYSDSHVWCQG